MRLKHPNENPEFWEGHTPCLSFGPGDPPGPVAQCRSHLCSGARVNPRAFCSTACAPLPWPVPHVAPSSPPSGSVSPAGIIRLPQVRSLRLGILSPSLNLPPGATLARHSPLGAFVNGRLPGCCLVKICHNVGNRRSDEGNLYRKTEAYRV